jgi:hypothetical protein
MLAQWRSLYVLLAQWRSLSRHPPPHFQNPGNYPGGGVQSECKKDSEGDGVGGSGVQTGECLHY